MIHEPPSYQSDALTSTANPHGVASLDAVMTKVTTCVRELSVPPASKASPAAPPTHGTPLVTLPHAAPAPPPSSQGPVVVYTDGSCLGNPGPGGWCALIQRPDQSVLEIYGHEAATTNNRMELLAVIRGLEAVSPDAPVTVYSDSQYVVNAFNLGWLKKWQRNGWRTQKGAVANQDLWLQLLVAARGNGRRRCQFIWVKGHYGNPMNERADRKANALTKRAR